MKWLTNFKSFIFALFFTTIGVISWGQEPTPTPDIEGSGTENNPFVINTVAGWNTFATTSSYWASGVFIELSESWDNSGNPVTTIVGYQDYEHSFAGHFDGKERTLTFNYTEDSDNEDDYEIAPFYNTDGATIKNLKVEGTINACWGYAAGLIYSNDGLTSIENVTVDVSVISNSTHGGCGGFSSYSKNFKFKNCVYNGKIIGGSDEYAGSGGFCGSYGVGGTMEFENCIFNPTIDSSIGGDYTFGAGSNVTITNCYHTKQVGSSTQGTEAYKTAPDDVITKPVTVNALTNTPVYGKVDVVADIAAVYLYDETTNYYSTVTGCTVTFDGETATLSTNENPADYSVRVEKEGVTGSVSEIITTGHYTLIIEGTNPRYYGSYSQAFDVSSISGAGTSISPFIISTAGEWVIMANSVNAGNSFSGKYFQLTNDITVSTMVGTSTNKFSGNFDGDNHTLTFNYGTNSDPTTDTYCAPFRYTNGADIHDLNVAGAIYTNVGFEAGLIGVNTGTTTVTNVVVSTNLTCNEALWYEEGGGFAVDGRGIVFSNCVYNGTMGTSNYSGGFCGMANNTTTFSNCLFTPASGSSYWGENFVYNNNGATISETCYYTSGGNQDESTQGTEVYVTIQSGAVGHYLKAICGINIYSIVDVVIGDYQSTYVHTGSVVLNKSSITVFFGETNALTPTAYCTLSLKNSNNVEILSITDVGYYTLTVTGVEATGYKGTVAKGIQVIESGSSEDWIALQSKLTSGNTTIDIDKDYKATATDAPLIIERSLTINLNNHTIDRGLYATDANNTVTINTPKIGGQVIRIKSGVTVVINGPGTIKGGNNKAENGVDQGEYNDGGGIWNKGNLTLNNVTIESNRCEKKTQDVSRTARGGGIYSGSNSTLKIYGGLITHNVAQGGGGGLFAEKATKFSINEDNQAEECVIQSNTSQDKGGGMRVDASGKPKVIINKCNINSNTVALHTNQSVSYGGGIHFDGGEMDMINCEINTNNATRYGGGIYIMKGTINANNCNIKYNRSYDSKEKYTGYGGGVCIMGGTYNMNGGMVYGNSCNIENGGGIFVNSNSALTLTGRVFVTGNWKYDQVGSTQTSTTNVFIMNKTGVITIKSGFDSSSRIGIAKTNTSGWTPVFTSGLYSNGGTISNFVSDFSANYTITRSDGEAKFSQPTNWNPTTSSDYTINDTWIVNTTINAGDNAITFGEDGCLIIVNNGCLTANNITNTDSNKIVLNGGQLITTSNNVSATSIKSVLNAYDFGQNWYVISTPFNTPTITMGETSGTNLITLSGNGVPEYDLYRFNEAATATDEHGNLLQWENYRSTSPVHEGFCVNQSASALENGRGYLYRNENNYTAVTRGTLNVEDVTYTLSYAGKNIFKGFHLIGNSFSHNIYKNDEYQAEGEKPAINDSKLATGYYRLVQGTGVEEDRWVAYIGYNNPIKPMEGVLVQATEAHSMTITKTTNGAASSKDRSEYDNIRFEVSNSTTSDVAYAMFSEGHGLRKIEQLNEQTPMLYIRRNNEDYAIATLNDNVKAFNLNFEAKTTGRYTLSVKPEGEFSYLHLIDKVAGEDIDMLQDSEYNFIGSPNDLYSRFIVKLSSSSSSTGNETFAYQSGNDIVVTGEGELQVFDVMGRMVMRQNVNGVETVNGLNKGVYIMRLNDMTQKIVIR